MAIVVLVGFTCLFVVVAAYTSLGGRAYRDPAKVLIAGMLVSVVAAAVKAYLVAFKPLAGKPWTAEEIDMAAAIVDPTLIGLAGGLIAAAFMTRMQMLHAEALRRAREDVATADRLARDVDRCDEDLKRVARSMSDEEFHARLQSIRVARVEVISRRGNATTRLDELRLPGSQ